MKIKKLLFLLSLMTFTTGCVDKNVNEEATKPTETISELYVEDSNQYIPTVTLNGDNYDIDGNIWKNKTDGKYYYLQGDKLCEIEMNEFYSLYKDNTYTIEFQWCLIDGELCIFQSSEADADFNVKAVDGNTEVVVAERIIPMEGSTDFIVCNIKEGTVKPLFEGMLSQYIAVDSIDVSKDVTKAVLTSKEPYGQMYFDGETVIDVGQLCGEEEADRLGAHFVGDYMIICAINYEQKDVSKPFISVYSYDVNNKSIQKYINNEKSYLQATDTKGWRILGRYGYCDTDDKINILDLTNNSKTVLEELKIEEVYDIREVDEKYISVIYKDGLVEIIDASTGVVVGKLENGLNYLSGVNIYSYNGEFYAGVWNEGEYSIYNIQ